MQAPLPRRFAPRCRRFAPTDKLAPLSREPVRRLVPERLARIVDFRGANQRQLVAAVQTSTIQRPYNEVLVEVIRSH